MSGGWQPLFAGADALAIQEAARAIAKDLEYQPPLESDPGRALLHAYIARAFDSREHFDKAAISLEQACRRMAESAMHDYLYGGFAGVGWLAAHSERLLGIEAPLAFDELDEVLLEGCRAARSRGYDLIAGWVGIGVYFLERLPLPCAHDGLRAILEILAASAERSDDGWTWPTPRPLLRQAQRASGSPFYNLGMAHGVPGIVSFAGEVARSGSGLPLATEIVREGSRWILRQRLAAGGFANWMSAGEVPTRGRLTWCYGELGVAVGLMGASYALDESDGDGLRQAATDVALASTERRVDAGIRDASICHGAAGNGHLYNRLYQATGHADFKDAARYWFTRALAMRAEGKGIGGYLRWRAKTDYAPALDQWRADGTFLAGASGTGLALLAAVTSIAPDWDRLLLSRLPCRLERSGVEAMPATWPPS